MFRNELVAVDGLAGEVTRPRPDLPVEPGWVAALRGTTCHAAGPDRPAPGTRRGGLAAIGDVVHRAMVETIAVPADDRFQVITEHPSGGSSTTATTWTSTATTASC
jgi:hypothetical protein